jgi:hypothetical protein
VTKEQIERLMEISPAFPDSIITKYKTTYPDLTTVAHPEVISGVKKVIVNRWIPEAEDDSGIKVKIMPRVNEAFSGSRASVIARGVLTSGKN